MKRKKSKQNIKKILSFALFICLTFFLNPSLFSQNAAEEEGWETLFNGKDLKGWKKLNGTAEYKVENNQIIGITKQKTPNTFLCTEKNYSDFILEFEILVDPAINSGVQFRSLSLPVYQNGRVHGYQVEVDPSSRAYSGGIYDEARRKWLYPLAENLKGRQAFKNGQWNKYRIEAIGKHIQTWLNGVQCANVVDDLTPEGFIALQVHSINEASMEGKTVIWRNIRIKTNNLASSQWKTNPQIPEYNYIPNYLSENEIRKGWQLLWDCKTTQGWRGAKSDKFPEKGWEIKDGVLIVQKASGSESGNGGDIITEKKFSNFELIVDFKITEGANSGIKYFVDPELNKGEGSAIGLEYQLLDDNKHPDAKQGVNGNRTLASLYDLIPADNLSVPERKKEFKGIGDWNRAKIIVQGNHVEHWLNNEKVLEYERGSQMYRALVANSKYRVWQAFGELPEGHILLQDHGDEVHFRNIKIREF